MIRKILKILTIIYCAIFLYLSFRVDGIDFVNYSPIYLNETRPGWDFGFYYIAQIFRGIFGLEIEYFLLVISLFTIFTIYGVSKKINLQWFITIPIYIVVFSFGRELSQIRVGFAISLFLYGLITVRSLVVKISIIILSLTTHLSVLILVLISLYNNYIVKFIKNKFIGVFLLFFLLLIINFAKGNLSIIDDRVNIYESSDSIKVTNQFISYLILVFIGFLTFNSKDDNRLFYLTFFPFLVYLAFFDNEYYAIRISNVANSFLPFILCEAVNRSLSKRRANVLTRIIIVLFIFSSSLKDVVPYVYEAIVLP